MSGYKILIILKSVQSWVRNFAGPAQIFFIVSSSCQSCHLVSLFSFLSFWFAHVAINVGSSCSLLLSYFFYLTCQEAFLPVKRTSTAQVIFIQFHLIKQIADNFWEVGLLNMLLNMVPNYQLTENY